MQTKTIKRPKHEPDFEKIYKAYAGLIEWIGCNDVDGHETLSLLIRAVVALAVTNDLDKENLLNAVAVTYEIERSMRPRSEEVH
jgi:hypothetical protein